MKITALEEYGLRCLLRVAEGDPEDPISASDIAEKEGLSLPYTQKLLRQLSDGNMVEARRGAHGGYYLGVPLESITLGDVIRKLGGVLEPENICEKHTGRLEECKRAGCCTIRPVWSHIARLLADTLDAVPVKALVEDDVSVEQYLEVLPDRQGGPDEDPEATEKVQ